jgi:DNA mismatch endonuclease, patch repair protein
MVDIFTKTKRSYVMSRIRGKGNCGTELRMIEIFRTNKITGWRRNHTLFGKPDFVFRVAKVAVFVDGCFWHKCPKHGHIPRGNVHYWRKKLARNVERDPAGVPVSAQGGLASSEDLGA